LLAAAPDSQAALRELKRLGFSDPAAALRNLHALTPTPREAELLAPALPRLLAELAAAPDPDMALNNLERLASQGERATFLRLLSAHPGAIPLLARLGGTSQFLADTLRRYPTLLPWLLEPRIMRSGSPMRWRRIWPRASSSSGRRRGSTRSAARYRQPRLLPRHPDAISP
jgi:glutamine synthetase adenylyltransferase